MHYALKIERGYRHHEMSPARPWGSMGISGRERIQRIAKRLTEAQSRTFEPGNVVKTSWGVARVVVEQRGQYVRIEEPEGNRWHSAAIYEFEAVDMREFEFNRRIKELEYERDKAVANTESKLRAEQVELSKNTITRALVHAHSNGYCSETAVALISAGHRLPDVTLDLNVTMRVSLRLEGNKSYYPIRDLFGATNGKVEGASGIDINGDKLYDKLSEWFGSHKFDYVSDVKLNNTTVDWKAPAIRQLSTHDAMREFESGLDNDDD